MKDSTGSWVNSQGWEPCGHDEGIRKDPRFVLEQSPEYFVEKEVLSMVIAQMVKFIARALEEKEGMRRSS
jgi:hypothetical protein